MGRIHLFVLVAFASVAAAQPKEQAAKDELKKLQGTWRVSAESFNGKSNSSEGSWTFKGDKLAVVSAPDPFTKKPQQSDYTISIDPSLSPKTIDWTMTVGGKPVTTKGIYSLDGEALKIGYFLSTTVGGGSKEARRPSKFDDAEKGLAMMVITTKQADGGKK